MHEDARAASSAFGRDPQGYNAGRLDYPDRVYDILRDRCGLGRADQAFEIGAGSGIATRRLLQLGVRELHAVEPDRRLAQFLMDSIRQTDARLKAHIGSFEKAELPVGRFDIGMAATSFHWLDSGAALAKVAGLLRPGGWWAMWWNIYQGFDGLDAFSKAIGHLYERYRIQSHDNPGAPFGLQTDQRLAELAAAGLVQATAETIPWNVTMSARKTRALYATFSPIRKIAGRERAELLDALERVAEEQFGGAVHRSFVTPIYTAQRPG